MKEHPILFSAPMVKALLERRKTQTRRLAAPRWVPGDRLWVREALTLKCSPDGVWRYSADQSPVMVAKENQSAMVAWAHHKQQNYCPSIHMPRWASRITLEVARTWAESLQDISEADAMAEGITGDDAMVGQVDRPYAVAYLTLWDSISGPGSAASNPLVHATEFKVLEVR